MTGFLTNESEPNSFIGLITNKQKKNNRKIFVKVESRKVVRDFAIVMIAIIISMAAGHISQQKMAFSQNPDLVMANDLV